MSEVCEYAAIRNPFQEPGAVYASEAGLSAAERWARQAAKRRIEHDRDRDSATAHGWELGPPLYVEYEMDGRLTGEWRSEILSRP